MPFDSRPYLAEALLEAGSSSRQVGQQVQVEDFQSLLAMQKTLGKKAFDRRGLGIGPGESCDRRGVLPQG